MKAAMGVWAEDRGHFSPKTRENISLANGVKFEKQIGKNR